MSEDQRCLVDQLAFVVGESWLRPMSGRLAYLDPIPRRLDGIVHSLLVELDGDGGINRHRLASKTHPDVDLLALNWSPRFAYPLMGSKPPPSVPAALGDLLAAIEERRNSYPAEQPAVAVVGDFITHVLHAIEQDFTLNPIYVDDDGRPNGEGADIAPGLSMAFGAVWASCRPSGLVDRHRLRRTAVGEEGR